MHKKMDLTYQRPDELVAQLCTRLRQERLAQQMTQAEVAARAGIGVNTLSNLESGRNTSFEGVVRVAMVLGRSAELAALFQPRLDSLDDMLRYEASTQRRRIKRKASRA